jgi:phage terminase large subunit-like protein
MSSLLADIADLLDPEVDGQVWYCDNPLCDGLPHSGVEYPHARAKQRPPAGMDWFVWLILAGRGFGKTRTGAEWLADRMQKAPNTFWAVVAPTFDDGRDTMIEGESGLLMVLDSHKVLYDWNRSLGQLTLRTNNARLDLFSSKTPEALRGPNLSGAWGDEPATWIYPDETWDNLLLMTRKGTPQIVLTGTPTPSKFVKKLKGEEADVITMGSSHENKDNLSERWYNKVVKPLEGTRKGRQEIYAEILEDIEGALWSSEQIDTGRRDEPERLNRLLVAVDPSVSASKGDECGIMVGGTWQDHGYLLDDLSLQAAPETWAKAVIDAYYNYKADAIVAEINNGGDLVRSVIHAIDKKVNVQTVTASRGKLTRAEPVAALYGDPTNPESWVNAKIHHVKGKRFDTLEEQMTSWVQGDRDSPDRLDALVWLFTKLLRLDAKGNRRGGLRYRD